MPRRRKGGVSPALALALFALPESRGGVKVRLPFSREAWREKTRQRAPQRVGLTRGSPALGGREKGPRQQPGAQVADEEERIAGGSHLLQSYNTVLILSVELGSEGVEHGRQRPARRSAQNRMRCANRGERAPGRSGALEGVRVNASLRATLPSHGPPGAAATRRAKRGRPIPVTDLHKR